MTFYEGINIVGVGLQHVFGVYQGHVWSGRAVGRALADVFEGIGGAPTPIMAVVRPKEAWRGLGNLAELPSTDGLGKVAYARYGSVASGASVQTVSTPPSLFRAGPALRSTKA